MQKVFFAGRVEINVVIRRTGEVEFEPRRATMKYLLLIYDREQFWSKLTEGEQSAIYADYMKFSQEIKESGNYLNAAQLHPIASATSVRVRDNEQLVTDGPFAETHEQLGGFYLIEAKDLDEATSIATRIPSARFGTIEIRPLVERATPASA